MSAELSIDVTVVSAAPPEVVWPLIADVRTWSEWGSWSASGYEAEGDPAPHGVGALRRLVRRPVVTRERVVTFEPGRELGYRLLSGLPLRDYRASLRIDPDGAGTRIRWQATFRRTLPASLVRPGLGRFFRQTALALAAAAELRMPGGG
jgi:Polyketide cyclase / dehydrase and lipid transport